MSIPEVRAEISGRYRLRSEIGSGGMGTVWHAEDTLLQRDVAVKEVALPPAVAAGESDAIRKRVLREARAAAALNHPNAVTVFDVIEEDGKAFIVMECIAGRTLDDIVKKQGPLGDDRVREIADDILSVLEAAHAAGIVHRDIKPANVMITSDGQTKVADFGIASVKDDPKITASGLVLGSPSYMAPEQATQGESGPEADLWGLGATMYFALEGVPPFERQGPIPTLTAVVGDAHRPFQTNSTLVPVIEALLAKDPATRPSPSAVRSLLADRSTPMTTAPVVDAPTTIHLDEEPATQTAAPDRRETGRRLGGWLLAAGAVVLLVVLVAWFATTRDTADVADRDTKPQQNNAPAAGSDSSDTAEDADADTGTDGDSAAVRSEWTTYEDPTTGYTLQYPATWEIRDAGGTAIDFADPETGTYLRVAYRSPPGPSLIGAWEDLSATLAAQKADYQELALYETTYQGMDAAVLEFTYTEGTALHAIDLAFITPDGEYGMALNFQTHAEDWESSQELFEQLKAGFRPPA